jgi:hypothetical protein
MQLATKSCIFFALLLACSQAYESDNSQFVQIQKDDSEFSTADLASVQAGPYTFYIDQAHLADFANGASVS